MSKFRFTVSAVTISKECRKNQDNMIIDKYLVNAAGAEYMSYCHSGETKDLLLSVSDGVGGQNGGEVASEQTVLSVFKNIDKIKSFNMKIINDCLDEINAETIEKLESEGYRSGATLSMLVINKNKAIACNIGDSPIFLFRKKKLTEISEEHTLAKEKGKLSIKKKSDYDANVLTKYIGNHEESGSEQAKMEECDVKEGDIFLICSDGITKGIPHRKIKNILKNTSIESAAIKLAENAKQHDADDDITVIVIKMEE